MNKFVALIILDGWGLSTKKENNAIYLARTPYFDYLLKKFSHTTLQASGTSVGLPNGQVGNSEVGHLNLGSGRIINQSLTKINQSISDKSFFDNEKFIQAIKNAKKHNSKIHLIGLISDGGVHSYLSHFEALLELSKKYGMQDKTYLHAFTDGRDTNPYSGIEYLNKILDCGFQLASISGRYYALDRDNNWDRINLVYNMLVSEKSYIYNDPLKNIKDFYKKNITDEFIKPFIVDSKGLIKDNDSIIFVNFRSDRIMRLATAFSNPSATSHFSSKGKSNFEPDKLLKNLCIVTMTFYSQHVKSLIAFEPTNLKNIYGKVISDNNLHQLRIAETEKYPHVTFFFDGGEEKNFLNEDKILIPSPKVKTYDLKPEMSAFLVTKKAKQAVFLKKYQTMILNFANPDMVGHTGSLKATIKAVEVVDQCLEEIVTAIQDINGIACIVADHGNAEQMTDENGQPHTAHTNNLVPFILTKPHINLRTGFLCDVAPTLLELLGISKPEEMTGKSLIIH
ncbi:MAG: 2,3-bisphosphoglycerate-independent phosphoglycerate mutase [Candidatus Phytoplasma stylosanthis]|uniref:2,3-bisphosphoglycerate-independent phosphoglycerate mutase n=1 Tax=Candidatus Phytoplasma stylosanthis TaxID=2798314 RepID=UPI00293A43C1|nr:2,3-bisphosphoglycerate-independent phosphoglycerate mutase [Candidatus Phytoplasma stylosanthis]MDV3168086.1 2,3-bisphosphoglycerate-independent phosphoglycerate mutase [Candidatus Phytoplasma stylosanthis]MDV3171089.1 2,3-bisphosphoglycerate-independent phosphoglycerate mutase [Candidatus Phytoplasma stylosanthis]MDV3173565.1 2,3-bisphosphoglycerate-independent phosphoglycerate mutase [Candidatus Phytoplasma stylosanthis]MDV3174374.1 2,3-bisphosphoglycerate-independent phosphoglycerate mut